MKVARLLVPALRWAERTGFAHEADRIDSALSDGVGGFALFGGEAEAVRELTTTLRSRSAHPLLIAADLERGAGQQFRGATQLPPLAALGALDDLGSTRQAAALTAREALALGVDWILAPVADHDLETRNPIVGTRAFGADPVRVAAHVTAWIEGAHAENALCCAKHFPGHGRTTEDSHAVLPRVAATREELEVDLTPFRAAVLAGADTIMTAHVAFPGLGAAELPATLSPAIIAGLLRTELQFDGLVVTDALNMSGVLHAADGERGASVAALAAGCDVLLHPADHRALAAALEGAIGTTLPRSQIARSLGRINAVAAASRSSSASAVGRPHDLAWAAALAAKCVRLGKGNIECGRSFDLITVDDDLGGPYPPPARDVFPDALRDEGLDPNLAGSPTGDREAIVAVYADIRAWKGRPGLSATARAVIADAVARRPDAIIVLFGHPRLAAELAARTIVIAWGGEAVMQRAAARWLAEAVTPPSAA